MRLIHYSNAPLQHVRSVPINERGGRHNRAADDKPRGLWVSDDDANLSWRHWCEAEEYGLGDYRFAHEIMLAGSARLLILSSPADIDALTRQFGRPLYPGAPQMSHIAWPEITAQWQGIIITPYIWARRLEGGSPWYYGWDCASGVIWDADAVASVGPAIPVQFAREPVDPVMPHPDSTIADFA